jgi:hypothetical protein
MRANARERLGQLRTGDGRSIPARMQAEIRRELDRLELLRRQIAEVEAERDALLHADEAPARKGGTNLISGVFQHFSQPKSRFTPPDPTRLAEPRGS